MDSMLNQNSVGFGKNFRQNLLKFELPSWGKDGKKVKVSKGCNNDQIL